MKKPTRKDLDHAAYEDAVCRFESGGTFRRWVEAVAAQSNVELNPTEFMLTPCEVMSALSTVMFHGLVVEIKWLEAGSYSYKLAHWYKGLTPVEIAFKFWHKWDCSGWADLSSGILFKEENMRSRARFLVDTQKIFG